MIFSWTEKEYWSLQLQQNKIKLALGAEKPDGEMVGYDLLADYIENYELQKRTPAEGVRGGRQWNGG